MLNLIRSFICLCIFLLYLSCGKEKLKEEEDRFIEETEQLSELKAEALSVGYQFIEIQWNPIYNTHFKTVTYSVYLNEKEIVQGLSTLKYSLINLEPGQEYSIKIIASTGQGQQTGQTLKVSTLSGNGNQTSPTINKEYKIHSYSDITGPTAAKRLPDGGHLIVKYLRHPSPLTDDGIKLIVLRTDKQGNLQWYRLLASSPHGLGGMPAIYLALHNSGKEGIAFTGGYAFKISAADGKILLEKELSAENVQLIRSLFSSPQNLIIGTVNGSVISINPDDFSILWRQENTSPQGAITAINTDSKGNIYATLISPKDDIHIYVLKYTSEGQYLSGFTLEGGFSNSDLLIDAEDNFYLFPHISTENLLYYIKFKGDGTVIKKDIIRGSFTSPQAFWNDKNQIVVYGRHDGGGLEVYGGIYVFDKEMKIQSNRLYNEIPYHVFGAVTLNDDGSYNIFLHYVQTYSYGNQNFVFIKTDTDGKI